MCNAACLVFGRSHLTTADVASRDVIEVGARDVNGSLRPDIERMGPASYVGVDVENGPGVDEICDISDLRRRFGADRFDVVIATEVMEHVREWRSAISNLKQILRPGGLLLLTTRSRGFSYHGYPYDFWRYEIEDMRTIFSDFSVDVVEADPLSPGVFVKAHKPQAFAERPLDGIELYSIVTRRRCRDISDVNILVRKCKRRMRLSAERVLPVPAKAALQKLLVWGNRRH
jgi:SAM-dependent methyltransferase